MNHHCLCRIWIAGLCLMPGMLTTGCDDSLASVETEVIEYHPMELEASRVEYEQVKSLPDVRFVSMDSLKAFFGGAAFKIAFVYADDSCKRKEVYLATSASGSWENALVKMAGTPIDNPSNGTGCPDHNSFSELYKSGKEPIRYGKPDPAENAIQDFHSLSFSPSGEHLTYLVRDRVRFYNYAWLGQARTSGGWQIPLNSAANGLRGVSLYHPAWVFRNGKWLLALGFRDWNGGSPNYGSLPGKPDSLLFFDIHTDSTAAPVAGQAGIGGNAGGISADLKWFYNGQDLLFHLNRDGNFEHYPLSNGSAFKGELNAFHPDSTNHMDYVLGFLSNFLSTDNTLGIYNRDNRLVWEWSQRPGGLYLRGARWAAHHNYVLSNVSLLYRYEHQYIVKIGAKGSELLKHDEASVLKAAGHIKLLEVTGAAQVTSVHLWVQQ